MYRIEQYMLIGAHREWLMIDTASTYKEVVDMYRNYSCGYNEVSRITKLARDLSIGDIPLLAPVYKAVYIQSLTDGGNMRVVYTLSPIHEVVYSPNDVVELMDAPPPGFVP